MLLTRPLEPFNHFSQEQQEQQQQQQQQQQQSGTAHFVDNDTIDFYDIFNTNNDNNNSSKSNNDNSTAASPRSNLALAYSTAASDFGDLPLDLDFSPRQNTDSDVALSPFSTHSWLSASSPSLMSNPELADSWYPQNQLGTKPVPRTAHNRGSSLSSLGSNGPASPFPQSTTNPHIAVTDSMGDGFGGNMFGNTNDSYYQLAKSYANSQDGFLPNYPNFHSSGSVYGNGANMLSHHHQQQHQHQQQQQQQQQHQQLQQKKPKSERGLLPPPELSASGASKSRPVSVASSVASHDSPSTPCTGEADDERRHRHPGLSVVPKLDRTMTDIYSDELYSPNFSLSTASPSNASHGHISESPSSEMFAQRLQAANQHLSTSHTPATTVSRDRSPFRNGSPLAPAPMNDFSNGTPARVHQQQQQQQQQQPPRRQIGFNSAQQIRENAKAQQDQELMQQQMNRGSSSSTPQTISPKDALLEFNDSDDMSSVPLFPSAGGNTMSGFTEEQLDKVIQSAAAASAAAQSQGFSTHGLPLDTSSFNFSAGPMAPTIQIPQSYPFVRANNHHHHHTMSIPTPAPSMQTGPSPSAGSHSNGGTSTGSASPGRPDGRICADGGTYTCTYHGCTLRFETPALLQKHKREGHRQAHGIGHGSRRTDMDQHQQAMTGDGTQLLNTQAGPHKCDRINPSTGKPCNTVFSRPYDLTRHEDTIHNGRKQKVRCDLCTEEKTFSRADALTRHYRVCHPDVEFPGKHRRRGLHGGSTSSSSNNNNNSSSSSTSSHHIQH